MKIGRIRKGPGWPHLYFVETVDNGITNDVGSTLTLRAAQRKLKRHIKAITTTYDQLYPIVEEIKIP